MASGREYSMLFKLNAELGSAYNSSFNSAKGPVLGLQTEINKLNKAQGDIAAYQKQQGAIDATRQKLKQLQQQYDNIQKEMTETGDSSADMKNKLIAKQAQIDRTSNSLKNHSDKLHTMDAALDKAGVSTKDLAGESKRLDTQIDNLKSSQEDAAQSTGGFAKSLSGAFASLMPAVTAAAAMKLVYEGMKAGAEAAIAFESAMAGVDKTSDLTKTELVAMGDEFQRMSTQMPVSANELANIAETAGQLGVAKGNLVSFTDVMAKLSTATSMTAEEGATMLAQMANITQMDPADYDNLASSVVDLGNNFATTEQKILDMSQGMAASADLAGMSEADILGLSAAISSLGIDAQAGSTSASKLITELDKAVKTGKGLKEFGRIAGMSGEQFGKAWGEDAAGALTVFIQGLNDTERNGKSATVILEELGITEVRMQRMMLSLAGSGDLMNRAMETSNKAWSDNNALQAEAEKRFGTTESKLTIAGNAWTAFEVVMGKKMTPAIQGAADAFTSIVTGLTGWIDGLGTSSESFGTLSSEFTGLMDDIAANNKTQGLIDEYKRLSGEIDGGAGSVKTYAEKQQDLWNAYTTGDMPWADYQDGLALLRTEYTDGITETGNYQDEEAALWRAFINGEKPIDDYTKELDKIRAQHVTDGEAVDTYKAQEAVLWEAYTGGEMPIGTYIQKLSDLRDEYGFNASSVEDLNGKKARLSQLQQELSDRSGGLISATGKETEALKEEIAAYEAILSMKADEARADTLDKLTKLSGHYVKALKTEEENTVLLAKSEAREAEIRRATLAGYDSTLVSAAALGQELTSLYDDVLRAGTVDEQADALDKYREKAKEASDAIKMLTGDVKDYSDSPAEYDYDLGAAEKESSGFVQTWLDAKKVSDSYREGIGESKALQTELIQLLDYGYRIGSIGMEEYQTILQETFGQYENGDQIVANLMEHVRSLAEKATEATAGMGDGMKTVDEQTLILQTSLDATKGKMDILAQAYTNIYESALASISGQLKLFEELKEPESTLTSKQMLDTLNQQAAYLDSYTANIKKASELGVAPELVKQLSDGSIESATYLQTIVNSGNTKIAELNTAFGKVSEGKETFATTLADIQTNFTSAMDILQSQLAADITAMNLSEDAAGSGKSTVQGFIDGANKMLGPVKSAYAAIAAAAAKALRITLDIESPSKVTTEIGKYTGMGLIEGALSQEEGFRRAMGDMAKAGVEAYQNKGLLDALGPGYFEKDGRIFLQAVNAQRDTGLMSETSTRPVAAASMSANYSGRSAAPVTIHVSPSYAFSGISDASKIKAELAKHNEELQRMILDVVDNRTLDLQRRKYEG